MMFFRITLSFDWPLFFEIMGLVLFVLAAIIITSFLTIRNLRISYREVFKYQSKFDIELRKIINLLSKQIDGEKLISANRLVVKSLTTEEKKALLDTIEQHYLHIDPKSEVIDYVKETYENLQEIRRIRDSKAIVFNHKIIMFPFNIYAKILKMKTWELYTHPHE